MTVHALVDSPPDEVKDAAAVLLARAGDLSVRLLSLAPLDDEPYTPEEQTADMAAVDEPGIPWEQVRAE